MKRKIIVALALAGTIGIGTAYAAGMWPDMPIIGGATYCAGSSQSATGTIIGAITGCPNQVPAGPTIVTGNEQIPADTRLAGGAAPQTVLVPMASLNALPITVMSAGATSPSVSAANTSGGVYFYSTATITAANVTLPPAPIDGQQYVISADRAISALSVTVASTQTLANNGAVVSLTNSTTAAQNSNFRFIWNVATASWYRL